MTTPEAASPLPFKGATPARQSRFHGGHLVVVMVVAVLLRLRQS